MLLIHLSDIHLKSTDYNNPTDQNQLLRRKLESDIKEMCDSLNKRPDAIIVSGDISFSSNPQEYEFAKEWLRGLCRATNADYDSVFVIPGNHDINRAKTQDPILSAMIDKIRTFKDHNLETSLSKLFYDEEVSKLLIRPLENYNNFAREFSCQMDYKENLHIKKSIDISDNFSINIWGLNSVITSNKDDDDSPANMYVVPSYHSILENDGEINIVACHHPFNWLVNGDKFKEHLSETAKIILFGHEHNNRIISTEDFIQVSASAVIPDSDGRGTLPGYNIINISIIDDIEKNIVIDLYIREWQSNPPRFREKLPKNGDKFWSSQFKLKPKRKDKTHENKLKSENNFEPKSKIAEFVLTQIIESKETPNTIIKNNNDSILSFLSLKISERINIAKRIGVWKDDFLSMSDKDASINIINSAMNKNLMDELISNTKK